MDGGTYLVYNWDGGNTAHQNNTNQNQNWTLIVNKILLFPICIWIDFAHVCFSITLISKKQKHIVNIGKVL